MKFLKALLDANMIRNIIANIYKNSNTNYIIIVNIHLESKKFDSKSNI